MVNRITGSLLAEDSSLSRERKRSTGAIYRMPAQKEPT
jgi:hypothetical protein